MSNGFALGTIDVVIIVASVLVTVAVGLQAARRQPQEASAYFLASKRLPWYIIGSAFVATSVSSEQIIGTIGATYVSGMGVANWEWFMLPVFLSLIFFLPVYLKAGIATVPEYLDRRFGRLCSTLYSVTMLVAYVLVFLVSVLYGGTLAFSQLTGIHFQLVLWAMVLLVVAYTTKGGLLSVMWTDAFQCVLLFGGGIILYFCALDHIPGGWRAMAEASPDRFHLYGPPDDPIAPFLGLVAGSVGVFVFYQAGNQVMMQRALCARTTWDAMMGVIFSMFIDLFRPLVTCFLGLIVYHWIHVMHRAEPLAAGDLAFPFALRTFAPEWGLRGIILAGFLAAVLSTISALANSTATIFSLEIYRRYVNRAASDARLVSVGRLSGVLALVAAAALAPIVPSAGGIFVFFQTGITYLATPFISVIILGLFWRRVEGRAGAIGIVAGIAIQIALALCVKAAGLDLHWLYQAFLAQVLTMLVVVALTVLSAPAATPVAAELIWSPGLLLSAGGQPWYRSLALWGTVAALAWGSLYAAFW